MRRKLEKVSIRSDGSFLTYGEKRGKEEIDYRSLPGRTNGEKQMDRASRRDESPQEEQLFFDFGSRGEKA
ncbi:hypothetical protein CMO96_01655 [Candidatus Woesebacteria bacterium]|nr:hypothetical protein [Candidatus Woesebacteria bacterium]